MEELADKNKGQPTPQKKGKRIIRRILRVVLWFFLGVILLNVLLYILLSIPAIQNKAVAFAVDKLKEQLKTEVSIGEIQLRLLDHLWVNGVYIEDQKQDTLLYAQELDVRISPLRLLKNQLLIKSITLDDFVINVNRKDSVSDYNFQFIIDAFAGDSTAQTDTTSSSMDIVLKDINIRHGRLKYDVLSDTVTPGIFNPSHISISAFTANLDINSIKPEALNVSLYSLSAKEQSGLEITSLEGKVFSEGNRFWAEGLSLCLPNSELVIGQAEYYMDNDAFALSTQKVKISPVDVKPFMPELANLRYPLILGANITGKLPMVNLENLEVTYGEEFRLKGNAYIGNYEDYGNSDIRLLIETFKLSPAGITDFAHLADSSFVAPDILNNWGTLYLTGKVDGKLNGFTTNIEAWGRQGAVTLNASGKIDTAFNKFDVIARLETKGINLGNLLGPETGLGKLALHVDLKANRSAPQNLTAQLRGSIDRIQYNDSINLNNILFSGFYNPKEMGASIKAASSVVKLRAEASMTQAEVPDIKFDIDLDSLLVDRFYDNPNWKNPVLSLCLNGNIKGMDIDKMIGKVLLDSIKFRGDNFVFNPDKFSLELIKRAEQDRQITLQSPFLSAKISGYYTFGSIADELSSILHVYMPALIPPTACIRKWQNNFTVDVSIKNTEKISNIIKLPVDILQPVNLNGRVNTIDRRIEFKGSAPLIGMDGIQIKGTTITLNGLDSSFQVTGKTNIDMENGAYNIALEMKGQDNAVHTLVSAANNDTVFKMNGNLEAMLQFAKGERRNLVSKLSIYPTYLNLGKLKLQMLPATITNSGNRTEINNFGIAIAPSGKKYVGVEGIISEQENDNLRLWFNKAQVGDLLAAFNINTIKAEIDGDIMIRNMQNKPEVLANDFKISDIIIFADTLGSLYLNSQWNSNYNGLKVESYLKKGGRNVATIDGIMYPKRDSLDMKVDIDRFPIDWAQPFVANMLNRLSGNLSMGMKIDGKISTPHVSGFLGLNDAAVGVDLTNVTYFVSDTINISPDYIGFKNLRLKDNEGNQATVNATVTYKDFQNMKYSLDMLIPQKLLVLNTVTRTDSMFYGKVYASGSVNIAGSDDEIDMNLKIKNGKNSNINITVPQVSEATDYKSVVFINVPEELLAKKTVPVAAEPLPLKMAMNIEVTPDFQLGILLDPSTNTTLKANGKGTINFTYDMMTENMSVFGDYTLHEGSVKLNLQGIKSFEFKIQEGGKLKFVGDPMNTNFDITAYRRVRADLKSLSRSFEAEGNTRMMVDCVLGIKGNINKMELTYDISLPDADDDLKRKVNSLISTDDEKIRQFAYLLATNSFYNLSGGGGGSITDGMWTSLASSTLSGALNAMFRSVLGEKWEIGTNIESNDGTFSDMDMSVNVSTRLFDDKLRLRTNVGYRNATYNGGENEFVGDFDAEYQLTKIWMLRAYNHTNDRYYKQAPYTQGFGIVYTKDAKTLKQLFKSFKPRRRNRTQQNTEGQEQKPNSVDTQKKPNETSGNK